MSSTYTEIIHFIRNLYQTSEGFIPLHAPVFGGNEKKYLEECIDSTFVSSVGKFVDLFEEKIAEYTGAKKAVSCVNGTNALHMALMLVGVENDTEVITQPLTFIATANAISYCGAKPVFLDVDLDTMGLSPKAVGEWLEENVEMREVRVEEKVQENAEVAPVQNLPFNKKTNRRISACVPMHTFGHPVRIDELMELCNKYNIPVVEDAAESLGSYYKGQHTGTFGKIGVLSFNGNKILTTGGGGMLLFQDEKLAKRAKHLTTQAKVPHPWEFVHDEIGYNYRMPNLNAALGLAQLEQLPSFLNSKRRIAHAYEVFFNDFTAKSDQPITFFKERVETSANYWLNCILLPFSAEKEEFLELLNENRVMTRPTWKLMNRLPMFGRAQADELQNALELEIRLVNIPSSALSV